MYKRNIKITAYALASALLIGGFSIDAKAATATSVLPGGGVTLAMAKSATDLQAIAKDEQASSKIEAQTDFFWLMKHAFFDILRLYYFIIICNSWRIYA